MLRPVFYILLIALWVSIELAGRRQANKKPANARELLQYSQKKTTPNQKISALVFSLLSVGLFAIWESVVAFLLNHSVPVWISIGALVPFFYELHLRRENYLDRGSKAGLSQFDILMLQIFTVFFLGSILALVLSLWIYYRAQHMPKNLYKKAKFQF